MDQTDPRGALDALIIAGGESYVGLSRLLGRNDAYLQQYVKRGSPRVLAERDRQLLARYFGVDEAVLGGPAGAADAQAAMVRVRRFDVRPSAGPGAWAEEDAPAGATLLDPALLRALSVRPADASLVVAQGDSMFPTIADGDEMLVDLSDRRIGARGGIYVLRIAGALVVKRVRRGEDCAIAISSDNGAYPALESFGVEIIGRVVWLARALK